MSIHQLIEMSRRSFRALDAGMNTAGENVANANNEAFARRRVTMRSESTVSTAFFGRTPGGTASGAGVSVETYERLRDTLLVKAGWDARGAFGASEEEHRVLSALQNLFPAHNEGSLSTLLNDYWNGWSDLADQPADNGARLALRSRASALASTLNRLDTDVRTLRNETTNSLATGIEDVNKKLTEITRLNESIMGARLQGTPDLAAEDRRDQLIGELALLAPVKVQDTANGGITLTIDGMAVVQGTRMMQLKLDTSGVTPAVTFGDTGVAWRGGSEGGGAISGWLRALTTTFPEAMATLDALAETLVKQTNALHTTGTGLNGDTGVNFFYYENGAGGEKGITASSIRISDEIMADSRAIAASTGDPTNGENDSEVALAIARLRDAKLMDGGTTTAESFLINMITGVGAQAARASSLYESRAAVANHLEAMERGVSGVSIEEEMTKLIQYQQSFQAAARVLNTADKMMETLLNM